MKSFLETRTESHRSNAVKTGENAVSAVSVPVQMATAELDKEPIVQNKSAIQMAEIDEEKEPVLKKPSQLKSEAAQLAGVDEEKEPALKKSFRLQTDPAQLIGADEEKEPVLKKAFQRKSEAAQLTGIDEEKEPILKKRLGTNAQTVAPPLLAKNNNTGIPNNLKAGVEALSGFSMDDVKVHYNSPKPAQLRAYAYAQGTDIHIGPGQEKHLPHEAWHVVQQKQGRVQPTVQMKEGIPVNDDQSLELEADVMGTRAFQYDIPPGKDSGLRTKSLFPKTIQRKLVINGAEILFVDDRTLPGQVDTVFANILADGTVQGDAECLEALRRNEDQVRRQLSKWIENAPGQAKASAKSHPEFGRKQQNRSYANYYDLARALLGWVEAKGMRHAEKMAANDVYANAPLDAVLNGLLGKLYYKIHNLEAEGLTDGATQQNILAELRSGLSIATGGFNDQHRWVADGAGQRTRLGHYQRHLRETAQRDANPRIDHAVPDDQLAILQNPTAHQLKDKIILLHDLMEYFGTHQSWNPVTAGQGLLPVESRLETMVTTGVDAAGERTGSVSMSDGTPADKKRARGMGLTTASRDENAANTLLARHLKLPVWAGQSMTTVRMMKLAQWVGASELEYSALAMGIFAYWRKDYDHRSDFAYHTLFEVLDVAKNFGVHYKMTPNNHSHPLFNIQIVLQKSEQEYKQLVATTKQFVAQMRGLDIGEPMKGQLTQLFQDIKAMDADVNAAYVIASDNAQIEAERNRNLKDIIIHIRNAAEKQRQIGAILAAIPIPVAQ